MGELESTGKILGKVESSGPTVQILGPTQLDRVGSSDPHLEEKDKEGDRPPEVDF